MPALPTRPAVRVRPSRVVTGLVLAVAAILGLCGCRIEPLNSTMSAAATASGATRAPSDLGDVRVDGDRSATTPPRLGVPTPFSVASTQRRVLVQGTGPAVHEGQRVVMRYVGVNGSDGVEFDSAWTAQGREMMVDDAGTLPGLVAAVSGVPVGSRVLVAIAPQDGYGSAGKAQLGIGPHDTMVVLVEVVSAQDILTKATGTVLPARPGLPTVSRAADGRPTVTLPRTAPPGSLTVATLVAGRQAAVAKGQSVTVRYTALVWRTGKVFDTTWNRGAPATFVLGRGATLAGWDSLIGRRVGSQVLLVIPPDLGYGAKGNPRFGVTGADTIVFVVDLLDARS